MSHLRPGFAATGKQPDRFRSVIGMEPIITQGEISLDLEVDKDLAEKRLQAIRSQDRSMVMGMDAGENNAHFAVLPSEPLIMYKGLLQSNGFEKLFPRRAKVMSSLNCMYIVGKKDGITQSDFEDQFEFIGISNGSVKFGRGEEGSNKVSSRIAGTGTTENTGNDEIHVGDDVVWSLPHIDESIRNEELKNLPELTRRSKHKLGVIFRKLDYSEATFYLQDALTETFDVSNDAVTTDLTVLVDKDRVHHMDDRIRLGLLPRALVAFGSYMGMLTALERGWIKVQPPANYGDEMVDIGMDNESFREINSRPPSELARGTVVYSEENRSYEYRSPNQLTPEELRRVSREKQWLAAQHGLFGNPYNAAVPTNNKNFLHALTCRTLRGMLRNQQLYAMGSIEESFPAEANTSYSTTGAFGINHIFNLDSLLGNLLAMQGRIGNDLYLASVAAKAKLDSRIALKSLSHALGGERMDYLLRLH